MTQYHTEEGHSARCEMDSHADTCVVGSNFRLIELTGDTADVYPYNEKYEAITDVPIVWAATAWTNPETGETVILDCFQALHGMEAHCSTAY